MKTIPESKVKATVRALLSNYEGLYSYWPVPSGYGRTTIDVLGCYRGRMFGIEVKRPGKKPTLNQTQELRRIERAMGKVFVVNDTEGPAIEELREWLDVLTIGVSDEPHFTPDQVNRHTL